MKRTAFIFFLVLIVFAGNAQDEITGLLGIPFGASESKVISEMKKKGYSKGEVINPGSRVFSEKIQFGKFTATQAEFYFIEDAWYDAKLFIVPSAESQLVNLFKEIVAELSTKYGEGLNKSEYKNDNATAAVSTVISDIKAGRTKLFHYFTGDKGVIMVATRSDMEILVLYEHPELEKVWQKKDRDKRSKDY